MNALQLQQPLAFHHISVDCVVIGFDGDNLRVLLLDRKGYEDGKQFNDMKLPGSLIYQDEDLNSAAQRVLLDLCGLKNVKLIQFKAYGSKNRTKATRDVHWLEIAQKVVVERIVTIAYLGVVKLDANTLRTPEQHNATWVNVMDIKELAFDHNNIVNDALNFIRHLVETNPSILFDLLPRKFTASQLRSLYQLIYAKEIDVRNFHKKIAMMDYVTPLEEKETGVAHRAARYYKFDRKIYNKKRR